MPPWAEENEAHCRQAKPVVTSNATPGFAFCGQRRPPGWCMAQALKDSTSRLSVISVVGLS